MEFALLGLVLDSSAVIAAAAIEQGYAVLTVKVRHFQKVPGLTVVTL